MKRTTLVIMAAGIGSRFGGGIKQLAPVGPGGEIIMDYSIHDALAAGFDRIVFVIRRSLEKDFKEVIGKRIEKIAPVDYVYQEVDALPVGYTAPAERTKPWGTGHAVLMVKDVVREPFLVINADDYYGREAFRRIHDYMVSGMDADSDVYDMCMGGFILENTLSENGSVSRGVCRVSADGELEDVTETYGIERKGGVLVAEDASGNPVKVEPGQYVSMNMWGLPPGFLQELADRFPAFLDTDARENPKAEFMLPQVIDDLIKSGKARVKVLETRDRWFGVTYQKDRAEVEASIRRLIAEGVYKERLYE
ncbi:MAG: NTP transferase domain-containing protein [Clostridiales bacterium]|nr:NTP transferase domain-containing protein [Clostridiales bacterium]